MTSRGEWAKRSLREVFGEVLTAIELSRFFQGAQMILQDISEHSRVSGNKGSGMVHIVAIGKVAIPMVREVIQCCEPRAFTGVVSTPSASQSSLCGLEVFQGGHPIPNLESLKSATKILQVLRTAGESDLVVFLISGGGSAAMELPLTPEISLDDLRAYYQSMVACGANIVEMNAIRKHLSAVKGARLALAAYPAKQITLLVSDVPEGEESSVASGPSMPDPSTVEDAREAVARYGLQKTFPASIVRLLKSPDLPETPKHSHPAFQRAEWHCLLSNADVLYAAKKRCEERGWKCVIDASANELPMESAVTHLLNKLDRLKASCSSEPACIVAGGEVTVAVRGNGIGGRNQEFVLACVERISGKRVAVLSAGTDGIDGNSPAAGAVADGSSFEKCKVLGRDPKEYLANSDSHTFFSVLEDTIVTGDTQTNVRDLRLLLAW